MCDLHVSVNRQWTETRRKKNPQIKHSISGKIGKISIYTKPRIHNEFKLTQFNRNFDRMIGIKIDFIP